MKAIWHHEIIAESNNTVVVENNHYFPAEAVNMSLLSPSNTQTHCPWKGEASYYNVTIDGKVNNDAAWYYPDPKAAAVEIKDRIAFWKGVEVTK